MTARVDRARSTAMAAGSQRILPCLRPIVPATNLDGVEVLKHRNRFLIADRAGDIQPDDRGLGLYEGDTRILSFARLLVDGRTPEVIRAGSGGTWRASIEAMNAAPAVDANTAAGLMPSGSLGIERDRWIDVAYHERITLTNRTPARVRVDVELGLEADMADIFEVRGYPRDGRGELLPIEVDGTGGTTDFGYLGRDSLERHTIVTFDPAPRILSGSEAKLSDGLMPCVTARWGFTLAAAETKVITWTAHGTATSVSGGAHSESPGLDPSGWSGDEDPEQTYRNWHAAATSIETDNPDLNRVLASSLDDLCLLTSVTSEGEPFVAAGTPWFSALFGRDALITGLETVAFLPWISGEALRVLAARQSTADDPSRDAEPGKILHEFRTGEMARSGEVPFGPYYGTVDATPLFLVLLGETYDWTGDDKLVADLWPNVLAALEWIDRQEAAGNGFIAYRARSAGGFPNQGWKDSPDAVRDGTGRLADPPIALSEVQGYVYDARRRIARLARRRGEIGLADALDAAADALRTRFAMAFQARDGVIPMALDGHGNPMDAVASNMGHCLWSGIVPDSAVPSVAERLMADDLFSGWGIRTYAANQPGYDPNGYHGGTVWPHDTAIAAAGLKVAGADAAVEILTLALLEAAAGYPAFRLPELFGGFARVPGWMPEPYPVACSPQAWSTAAPLFLVRTMLGLRADAARGELALIRPHLPPTIGEVTLRNLRVGAGSCDLRVRRRDDSSTVEVLRADGVSVNVN